jgi:ankyrin repeat protein
MLIDLVIPGSEAPSLIDLYGMETGLQLAAREGRKEMLELLLRRGADKTKKGGFRTKGETAVEIADAAGWTEIAILLREQ